MSRFYGWIDGVHVVTYSSEENARSGATVWTELTAVMPASNRPHLCAEGFDGKFGHTVLFTAHLQAEDNGT